MSQPTVSPQSNPRATARALPQSPQSLPKPATPRPSLSDRLWLVGGWTLLAVSLTAMCVPEFVRSHAENSTARDTNQLLDRNAFQHPAVKGFGRPGR